MFASADANSHLFRFVDCFVICAFYAFDDVVAGVVFEGVACFLEDVAASRG